MTMTGETAQRAAQYERLAELERQASTRDAEGYYLSLPAAVEEAAREAGMTVWEALDYARRSLDAGW